LYRVVKKFEAEGAMPLSELSESVNIPRKYVLDICHDLERAKLITRVDSDDVAFNPTFDINKMDLYSVLDKLENEGMGDFDSKRSEAFDSIEKVLVKIEGKWKGSELNKLIKDL